jgi:hypothetical protein
MQPLIYTVCGLGVVGLVSVVYAAFRAPEAVEDERGFHLLDPVEAERYEGLPHATLTEGDVVFFK